MPKKSKKDPIGSRGRSRSFSSKFGSQKFSQTKSTIAKNPEREESLLNRRYRHSFPAIDKPYHEQIGNLRSQDSERLVDADCIAKDVEENDGSPLLSMLQGGETTINRKIDPTHQASIDKPFNCDENQIDTVDMQDERNNKNVTKNLEQDVLATQSENEDTNTGRLVKGTCVNSLNMSV